MGQGICSLIATQCVKILATTGESLPLGEFCEQIGAKCQSCVLEFSELNLMGDQDFHFKTCQNTGFRQPSFYPL